VIDHLRGPRAAGARPLHRITPIAAAVLSCALAGQAAAFEIQSGNDDLSMRWDNTFRLNYAQRVQGRDNKIGNSVLADEGDYSFDNGDAVAKRIDLLSEFDLIYKKKFGGRVSAAGWYDAAYDSTSHSNPNLPLVNIPSYINHQYSGTTSRFYEGPSGEVLDAFVFGGVDLGNVPVQAKLGRHTVYWGESLFLGGHLHSVSYSQVPLDLQKGFATPGTEAKELFRPLNQLSLQAQVTDELSLAGQYLLQWEAARYPEGGTYLGPVDFVFNGPDRQFLSNALGFANRGEAVEPSQHGEYGLSARWAPKWLDGTMGFYYRNYADKLPQVLLTQACAVGSTTPTPACATPSIGSRYNLIYADHINMYGVSLAKNIAGISFGAEVSKRVNTPLNSQVLGVSPGLPNGGDTNGARGDTWHALVNALGVIPKTPIFDTASWAAEFTFSNWSKVRSGANLFNALGYAPCNGKDKWDGCVTKDYLGVGVSFAPTWFQVLPGVDLSAPLTYAVGLSGNAATTFGGNEALGNYTVGVGADVYQKYRFDLKYVDFVGRYKDNGTAVTSVNGLTTYLKDRGFVSLTFKTTF
jgi:Protein of unknown function (DUF1302)